MSAIFMEMLRLGWGRFLKGLLPGRDDACVWLPFFQLPAHCFVAVIKALMQSARQIAAKHIGS
ncbi:hypothetical protein J7432_12105 [Xanthomonas axonopodis pv. begoniae]|nr:hypothetical protein [Xanthomonas axonopodis pv. begoniae]MBO9773810.1 hypothetical protein [Xanthomonas axonopodis pv. begoniae]